VCIGPFGNLFIADTGNNVIRAVNFGAENFTVGGSVVIPQNILNVCGAFPPNPAYGGDGGPAPSALLNGPEGIKIDGWGHLYVADTGNHRIRVVNTLDPSGGLQPVTFGNVTVNAGDIDTITGMGGQGYGGDGTSAVGPTVLLDGPSGLLVLPGGVLVFSERANHTIRAVHLGPAVGLPVTLGSITLQGGNIDTLTGQGPASPGTAGDGGDFTLANLSTPRGLAHAGGALVVCEAGSRLLRVLNTHPASGSQSVKVARVSVDPGEIDTLRSSPAHPIVAPSALDYRFNGIFITDQGDHRVLKYDIMDGSVAVLAGDGFSGASGDSGPALSARFDSPGGIVIDGPTGKIALVADTGNHRIRAVHIDPVTGGAVTAFGTTVNAGEVETLPGTVGQLTSPTGLAQGAGGDLFIADTGGHRVVRVARATGTVTVVAGTGTSGAVDGPRLTAARFDSPEGLALSSIGNVYVADTGNHTLRLVNLGTGPIVYGTGPSQITIATGDVGRIGGIAGTPGRDGEGREAWLSLLDSPVSVGVDGFGAVTFTERGNSMIRRVRGGSGTLVALAGAGSAGFNGDGLPKDQTLFDSPHGLATSGQGDYFVADSGNGRLRRFRAP
jgi:sugar lactone lactonase YvrE